ncbi:MAG: hypothetical protein HY814_15225 [Candidatus Riflebacteria bacterium]|nr:hypothetical protein [Candidatus Riflebacteria bacterium]
MKRSKWQALFLVSLIALFGGISMTDQGQVAVHYILRSVGAAAASPDRYQVKVLLQTTDGRSYEYVAALDDSDIRDLRSNPSAGQERQILLAKKAMAERYGYSEGRYGNDHYKMLSSPRLMGFKVTDTATNRTEDMFREERRRGNFANIYAE